jgi:phosphoglycerate dehydrogenase-like enzyme
MTILVAIYSPVTAWCIPEAQVDQLRREFPDHTFIHARSDTEMVDGIAHADAVFSAQIKPAHFAAATQLKWIHSPAAGVGGMLFPELVRSDVTMTNSRGTSALTIAEHTVAVTMALLRDLPLALRRQAQATWAQNEFHASGAIRLLRGSRVLIVGLGAIGGETARLMSALGATVVGVRRHLQAPVPPGVSRVVPPPALRDELPHADIIVVAAPQTAATDRMIGRDEFALMKPDAILVNVSRGRLIDEPALVEALDARRLRAAALDVFDEEPLPVDSPLWARENVLITPHVSGFHAAFWPDLTALFAENLRRFLHGRPLRNVVDKAAGY